VSAKDSTRDNHSQAECQEPHPRRASRRTFIKAGVAAAGGIIAAGDYVKPTLHTVPVSVAQAFSGQGSVEVNLDIYEVNGSVSGPVTSAEYSTSPQSQSVTGVMYKRVTITNVSSAYVPVKIVWVRDYIQYRLDGTWHFLAEYYQDSDPNHQQFSTVPTILNDVIYDPKSKQYTYDLPFEVPADTQSLKNTIEIKLERQNANKEVFWSTDSYELPRADWRPKKK
jgi:hypothetical protein